MGRKVKLTCLDIPEEVQNCETNIINPKMKHFYPDGIGLFQDDFDRSRRFTEWCDE